MSVANPQYDAKPTSLRVGLARWIHCDGSRSEPLFLWVANSYFAIASALIGTDPSTLNEMAPASAQLFLMMSC